MGSGCVPGRAGAGTLTAYAWEEGGKMNEILKVILVGIFTTIVAALNTIDV